MTQESPQMLSKPGGQKDMRLQVVALSVSLMFFYQADVFFTVNGYSGLSMRL